MRFVFAGTAPFAELVLDGLAAADHLPVALITNPDRPRGRHGTPQAPPIKGRAAELGLPVAQPEAFGDPASLAELMGFEPHVLVACAYGQIVPQAVLDAVETIVVHPSLLPRWRGAAPVERALMAGETELGVCVLRMVAEVDAGPIGDRRTVHVPRGADAGDAYARLAPPATAGILAVLGGLAAGTQEWRPQEGEPTYAAKLGPDDRTIDWRRPATTIADQVRALSPHIGAVTELCGRRTRIWRATPGAGPRPTGGSPRLILTAGEGWLEVHELQQEGRTRMAAGEFLCGAGRSLLAT